MSLADALSAFREGLLNDKMTFYPDELGVMTALLSTGLELSEEGFVKAFKETGDGAALWKAFSLLAAAPS